MRNKGLAFLMTLMLCMVVFSMPIQAHASETKDTTPPTLTVTPKGENVIIVAKDEGSGVEAVYMDGKLVANLVNGSGTVAIRDYVTIEKTVGVYAVDHAGNRSEMVFFNSPDPNAAAQATQPAAPAQKPSTPPATQPPATQSPETTAPAQNNPLTPDGNGSILDEASGEDDKQFYTITTADGNVFYLILDGQRDSQNVYFLNKVTEQDLMALAEGSGSISVETVPEVCTCVDKCEPGAVYTPCPLCLKDLKVCLGKEKSTEEPTTPTEPVVEEPKGDSDTGLILLMLAAMGAVAGVGYYVKVLRPKQLAQEEEDDDYGEDFDPGEAYGGEIYLSEDDEDSENV